MKKIFLSLIFVVCQLSMFGQLISFPAPELRVDTIKPLNAYGITFPRPTTMINKLLIRGNQVPPTFYLQIVDSLGYNRFGITKNGMLITGTHHDPEVEIDGLFMMGRNNALKGPDSFVAGKGVVNQADSAGAIGYYFTASKNNSLSIGYGNNRIEMSADSGRFVGNWKLSGGGGTGGLSSVTTANSSTISFSGNGTSVSPLTATANIAWSVVTGKPTFSAVATSGSYADLTNKPTIPSAQVNSDWNASSGVAQILNKPTIPAAYSLPPATASVLGGVKTGSRVTIAADGTISANQQAWADITGKPTFATVATSGSYNDLSNKPAAYTLPAATSSTLGGIKQGANIEIAADGTISATALYKRTSGDPTTYTFSNLDVSTGYGVYWVETTISNPAFPTALLNSVMEAGRSIEIFWYQLYDGTALLSVPNPIYMVTGSFGNWTMNKGIYYMRIYKKSDFICLMIIPKPQWP